MKATTVTTFFVNRKIDCLPVSFSGVALHSWTDYYFCIQVDWGCTVQPSALHLLHSQNCIAQLTLLHFVSYQNILLQHHTHLNYVSIQIQFNTINNRMNLWYKQIAYHSVLRWYISWNMLEEAICHEAPFWKAARCQWAMT